MQNIWLTNSDKEFLVDEIDYFHILLFGPYNLVGSGYVRTTGFGQLYVHHLIAERMGFKNYETIDHLNRNPLDNRRENLKAATYSVNLINRSISSLNTSGHKFIVWNSQKGKWQVEINRTSYRKHLGFFDSIIEALLVRNKFLEDHNIKVGDL